MFVVLSCSVPLASIENTSASAIARMFSFMANPPETTAAPPSARKIRPPRLNDTPKSSWKPSGEIVMSTKPLPFAKPRNSTSPSIRSRKPGSTLDEPSVWTRPVVFSDSRPLTENFRPIAAPKSTPSESWTRATRPVAVDPEAAVDEVDAADRREVHRAVHDQLDAGVRARELDPEQDLRADVERVGDDQLAGHDEPEAADDFERLARDEEAAGGVVLEAVEDHAAGGERPLLDLERVDALHRGERVQLEQEDAVELDARDRAGVEREEDAPDDAGVRRVADEDGQVQRSRERPEERDLRARRRR